MVVPQVSINYLAVLVASIAGMVVGAFWYSPLLFGKVWMRESGISSRQINEAKKRGMGKSYFAAFVGILVMSFVLAHFVRYAGATTWTEGLEAGCWLWLGFIAPVLLGSVLWEGKSVKLYLINALQYLVVLLMMGAILASWV